MSIAEDSMRLAVRYFAVAIFLVGLPAWGGVRPRYGGMLRVAMAESLASLDPEEPDPVKSGDAVARARVTTLLFDTLVRVDAEGRGHPQLAVAWQADRSYKRWQFWLRPGVKFWDRAPLTAEAVVASLSGRAEWKARADGEFVVIESEVSRPGLLAELALARNAVVRKGTAGELVGTGPFLIKSFVAGKSLELAANDGSWGGRPFVDGVQIEFGKSLRDQMVAFQLGKVDLIEVGAEQIGKVESEGRKAQVSFPVELVAVVGGTANVREALSLAVDRKSIQSLLLRGGSETAGGVLPEWMSGTGALFPVQVDLQKGRSALKAGRTGAAVPTRPLTLSCDTKDGLGRLLADRVALNAREVGLSVQVVSSGNADMHLERIPLVSGDPGVALEEVGRAVGVKVAAGLSAPGEIYLAERKLMDDGGVVPLFHLPLASLAGDRVKSLSAGKLGSWQIDEAWLETGP